MIPIHSTLSTGRVKKKNLVLFVCGFLLTYARVKRGFFWDGVAAAGRADEVGN
jgi:hypothetical protein